MNFNISNSPEYNLYGTLTQELINLYGIECYYCIIDRINIDEIFGEHTRISVDDKNIHSINILPSETENFSGDIQLSQFGIFNNESLTAFISKDTMCKIHPDIVEDTGTHFDYIIGNLIIFKSNRIMEISGFSPYVEGSVNNLFVYNDNKNIYKITLKTYLGNSIEKNEVSGDVKETIADLDEIFNFDEETRKFQDELAQTPSKINKKKSVVHKYQNVFGDLG